MAKRDVIEVTGDSGDAVFVTALVDDAIGLTVVDYETGRAIYIVLNRESVGQLADVMIAQRDK